MLGGLIARNDDQHHDLEDRLIMPWHGRELSNLVWRPIPDKLDEVEDRSNSLLKESQDRTENLVHKPLPNHWPHVGVSSERAPRALLSADFKPRLSTAPVRTLNLQVANLFHARKGVANFAPQNHLAADGR
jgi:hypothetical protein